MKPRNILLTMIFLSGAFTAPEALATPPNASQDGEYSMFYDDLLQYGRWIELEPGVVVWRPYSAYSDWRPYSVGRWVWTRYGWYWMSDEPYGWAVFHYGRWSMHPRYGWIWYPGRVWGPAWVEWRYSDSYIGWAPLPPFAVFHVSFGIRFTRHWVAPVNSWCFVNYSTFGGPIHRDRLLSHERVRRVIGSTRRGRTTTIERDQVINRGIERDLVERRGSRVQRYEVAGTTREGRERVREGRIEVYRPDQDERRSRPSTRERSGENGIRGDETRRENDREFTRPGQDRRERPREIKRTEPNRRDVRPQQEPSRVPDRRVAPSVRSRPDRSSPKPDSRTPSRSPSGRKRDH